MDRVSLYLRVAGFALSAVGVMFFPVGYGVSPKRDTSAFSQLVDAGGHWQYGVAFFAVGGFVLLIGIALKLYSEKYARKKQAPVEVDQVPPYLRHEASGPDGRQEKI